MDRPESSVVLDTSETVDSVVRDELEHLVRAACPDATGWRMRTPPVVLVSRALRDEPETITMDLGPLEPLLAQARSASFAGASDPPSEVERGRALWRDEAGALHRDIGPAVVAQTGYLEHRRHGMLHNELGPAIIWPDGRYEYDVDGVKHNLLGPAVVDPRTGWRQWWIEGVKVAGARAWDDDSRPRKVEAILASDRVRWGARLAALVPDLEGRALAEHVDAIASAHDAVGRARDARRTIAAQLAADRLTASTRALLAAQDDARFARLLSERRAAA